MPLPVPVRVTDGRAALLTRFHLPSVPARSSTVHRMVIRMTIAGLFIVAGVVMAIVSSGELRLAGLVAITVGVLLVVNQIFLPEMFEDDRKSDDPPPD